MSGLSSYRTAARPVTATVTFSSAPQGRAGNPPGISGNDEDTDGLSVEANKLDANSGTIQQTADTSVAAVLTHAAVAASDNHKVDGVKPTLKTTGDDAPKTSVDGSQIDLVFSENIGTADHAKFTVKKGTTTVGTSGQSWSGKTARPPANRVRICSWIPPLEVRSG